LQVRLSKGLHYRTRLSAEFFQESNWRFSVMRGGA
jgi:hypothetical protein